MSGQRLALLAHLHGRAQRRRQALPLVVAGVLLAATSGCGSSSPGDAAPGLRTALTRVDAAVAARNYDTAREALADLVRQTAAARRDGKLNQQQTDRIRAAAARLVADLPQPATATPTPISTPTPTRARPGKPPKPEKKPKGHGKGKPRRN